MAEAQGRNSSKKPSVSFAVRFWHWRLKKYLYAPDYGYRCWPIGKRG